MSKYENNVLAEPMDAIILLSDNYTQYGLKQGYIGVVVDNFIQNNGCVLADFFNPFTGDDIAVQVLIGKDDFRVLSDSADDRRKVKSFKDLFKK